MTTKLFLSTQSCTCLYTIGLKIGLKTKRRTQTARILFSNPQYGKLLHLSLCYIQWKDTHMIYQKNPLINAFKYMFVVLVLSLVF